jgi:hypothetical protein
MSSDSDAINAGKAKIIDMKTLKGKPCQLKVLQVRG